MRLIRFWGLSIVWAGCRWVVVLWVDGLADGRVSFVPFVVLLGGLVMALVFRVRMPDGVAAKTDGVNIWVDDRLNDIQLKCAVQHELVHVERGHSTTQPEAVELSVRFETAKRLLPVMTGCQGSTLAAAARNKQVTRQVLMDRAATLTDEQARIAGCMECQLCPVIQARYSQHPVGRRYQQQLVA